DGAYHGPVLVEDFHARYVGDVDHVFGQFQALGVGDKQLAAAQVGDGFGRAHAFEFQVPEFAVPARTAHFQLQDFAAVLLAEVYLGERGMAIEVEGCGTHLHFAQKAVGLLGVADEDEVFRGGGHKGWITKGPVYPPASVTFLGKEVRFQAAGAAAAAAKAALSAASFSLARVSFFFLCSLGFLAFQLIPLLADSMVALPPLILANLSMMP